MHAEEFKTKVLPLSGSLYRFAKSFLHTNAEAEDCVQDIFLKLWMRRQSLASVENLKAFAMQMVRNLCLDKLKRSRQMVEIGHDLVEPNKSPYQQLETLDTMSAVEKIIQMLPETQRTAIHLRNIEGLDMKEIAAITGMNIEHVRVTLSRARIAVRQHYQKYFGNE